MSEHKDRAIRQAVRDSYGEIAKGGQRGCSPSCCGHQEPDEALLSQLGYSKEDLRNVPEGSYMGLGCGNPQAIASLQPGEVVLDLGSGGGFDCFLAARQVGDEGRVIGVDMTPEMVARASERAIRAGISNVEFRLGDIEGLPLDDSSVDVIISNCVINLCPQKAVAFREAFRVLRPGGRLAISDIVATEELPAHIRGNMSLYCGCIAGAALMSEVEAMLVDIGFMEIQITIRQESRRLIGRWLPGRGMESQLCAAIIEARKP